jgi:hypothetical protein
MAVVQPVHKPLLNHPAVRPVGSFIVRQKAARPNDLDRGGPEPQPALGIVGLMSGYRPGKCVETLRKAQERTRRRSRCRLNLSRSITAASARQGQKVACSRPLSLLLTCFECRDRCAEAKTNFTDNRSGCPRHPRPAKRTTAGNRSAGCRDFRVPCCTRCSHGPQLSCWRYGTARSRLSCAPGAWGVRTR